MAHEYNVAPVGITRPQFIAVMASLPLVMLCGCTSDSVDIKMPHASSYYTDGSMACEQVKEELENLGFTNVRTEEKPGHRYAGSVRNCVEGITIRRYGEDGPWKAGVTYGSKSLIWITYNPVLTVEECPELAALLSGESNDYMATP